jgi:hypothetical protein
MVGDRGMIRSEQMAEAKAAGFHYITAMTKPQIEGLLRKGTFQIELFEEKVTEVAGADKRRYVLSPTPSRPTPVDFERGHRCSERTVAAGRMLCRLNVMELVATESGEVVTRLLPQPSALQQQLLESLKLTLPEKVPAAKVTVGTRVKLSNRRKSP